MRSHSQQDIQGRPKLEEGWNIIGDVSHKQCLDYYNALQMYFESKGIKYETTKIGTKDIISK